ncbi:long-chain fatty acid--CoA ligase [Acaricomes phytoseiuli]|uniref:long-chain-fatty-acid--CoA ligase n=1 Tax=Acaricomes phytoseiuli TaxID=291968 RepID=UPI0022218B53|nr:long-chain fatty acid--CoA ligase [Acaricomes phytoseiuli]MCW1248839.1 long-chain fatty acid--CoA ligase [Acaricomes phytoseiuli]
MTSASVSEPGEAPSVNLAAILTESAAHSPEALALKLDETELSYAALDQLSARFAGLLRDRGIAAGERILLISPNLPQMPVAYYGALRHGSVVVPLNPLLKSREIEYHLKDSEASLVVVWEGVLAEAAPAAAEVDVPVLSIDADFLGLLQATEPEVDIAFVTAQQTAVILYTSGTTGRPKGAELTHANLLHNAQITQGLFDLGEGDVIFGGLPFFHIFGQTCALNAAILSGATVTLLPRFDPEQALRIIQRDQATIFQGVPTMYIGLLRAFDPEQHDVSTLRVAVSGGASLPLEVLRGVESTFDLTLLEGYGLSETSPVVTFNQQDGIRKPGSIGTPVRDAELRVTDLDGAELPRGEVGELLVRGPQVMKGYWRNPEATAAAIQDGWFATGDLARQDEDGVFFIVDRKKDMILRGGYNVYPREVEEVLYEHPAVVEVAVLGKPDTEYGEEVVAVIALAEGAASQDGLLEQIQEFAKERLAAYKYPRELRIVPALPKGPTGKILKREIEL